MPFITVPTTRRTRDASQSPTVSWLSRSSSSDSSFSSPRVASPRVPSSTTPVTYIPSLIDGACGTLPAEQRPALSLLSEDLKEIWAIIPQITTGLRRNWRSNYDLVIRLRDFVLQFWLSVVEVAILALVVPLWMMLPGVVFLVWFCFSISFVLAVSSFLNGTEVVVNCDGSGSRTMEPDIEEQRWVFVGGITTSIDRLSRESLPLLSKLFMHPITGVHTPTFGLPFDLLLLAFRRSFPSFPSESKRALYSELRGSLLDSSISRVVVLAQGTGAVLVASTLSRLSADIQAEKLTKLEIYTFGAASREFVVPLGKTKKRRASTGASRHDGAVAEDRCGPRIEHFAFVSDPFAQMGILRAVYRDFDVRFCGDIFVMRNHPHPSSQGHLDRPTGQLSDYLCALFPTSLLGCCDPGRPSLLDYVMGVDRDTAEKRELAAIESYAEIKRSSRKNRRSWTGLGATVGSSKNGVMDGLVGLQMARKSCRNCEGHRGRDVSWLADHVRGGDMIRESEGRPEDAPS
ncbi:hypothetical protein ACRALDRAFT_1067873 [Sodiomyces alcalophilus JCM 7366]|uniref:uncharacterized protein n=1 Tax=Sodiomyces alcalophilus JCM 7366 TaxID=591952 RepID=UPI0039B5594A